MALNADALTTVRELESELGLEPGTQTRAVERAINAASAEVARIAERVLHRVSGVVDRVEGHGGSHLVLPRAPVVSITSIVRLADDGTTTEETYDATSYDLEDADAGIVFRAMGWPWTATRRDGVSAAPVAGSERASLRVTYTAGWITPYQASATGGSVGTRDLPYDLEEACLIAAVTRYRGRGRDRAVVREQLGPESVTFAAPGANSPGSWLPPEAYQIAAGYRRTL